jgi:hypothetical protein
VDFGFVDLNPWSMTRTDFLVKSIFECALERRRYLFGATKFSFNASDLEKDVAAVDVPAWNVKLNRIPQPDGRARIVSSRAGQRCFEGRLRFRAAREGKHLFRRDYIYFLFWYEHPKSPWPDVIPESFVFEQTARDSYAIKETGISGVCLVGAARGKETLSHETDLELRTHVFPMAGGTTRRLLDAMNRGTSRPCEPTRDVTSINSERID